MAVGEVEIIDIDILRSYHPDVHFAIFNNGMPNDKQISI